MFVSYTYSEPLYCDAILYDELNSVKITAFWWDGDETKKQY